jgi:hypothetical protein
VNRIYNSEDPVAVWGGNNSRPGGFRNVFKWLLTDVAYNALLGLEVRLLSDFPAVCAENDTPFFVIDSYAFKSGFTAKSVDRLRDVFQTVEQHALVHGP